ncbi:MAG TPA: hypothetical protein VIW26_13870 [Gemmatimonadales bacterium]|jgi:hypothetical protein
MRASHLNASLIAAGAAGVALAVRLLAAPLVRIEAPPRVGGALPQGAHAAPSRPDSLGAALVHHDPFRVTRRSSEIVYDPVQVAQPAPTTPPSPSKPTLTLVGIVWDNGRDPTALLEGLPGVAGQRPMREGDTVAGLKVKAIKSDRVVITGLDTMWTLTVREPWR